MTKSIKALIATAILAVGMTTVAASAASAQAAAPTATASGEQSAQAQGGAEGGVNGAANGNANANVKDNKVSGGASGNVDSNFKVDKKTMEDARKAHEDKFKPGHGNGGNGNGFGQFFNRLFGGIASFLTWLYNLIFGNGGHNPWPTATP